MRTEMIAQHPDLTAALNRLGGMISDSEMRQLNYAVDVEHQVVAIVAGESLDAQFPVSHAVDPMPSLQ